MIGKFRQKSDKTTKLKKTMQDTRTGNMEPLFINDIPVAPFQALPGSSDVSADQQWLQAAKDAAIPDRNRQGGILALGQIVKLCGCSFKVHAINGKKVILKGIPS